MRTKHSKTPCPGNKSGSLKNEKRECPIMKLTYELVCFFILFLVKCYVQPLLFHVQPSLLHVSYTAISEFSSIQDIALRNAIYVGNANN